MAKFDYWHRIIDAHPIRKKELTKSGSKLRDLIMTAHRAYKPEGRIEYMNIETGKETWIDVRYLGRLPKGLTKSELKRQLKEKGWVA